MVYNALYTYVAWSVYIRMAERYMKLFVCFNYSFRVWHGSNALGEISATCDGWTSNSGQGDASLTTLNTLLSTSRISCSEQHYLLCIQIVRQ